MCCVFKRPEQAKDCILLGLHSSNDNFVKIMKRVDLIHLKIEIQFTLAKILIHAVILKSFKQ